MSNKLQIPEPPVEFAVVLDGERYVRLAGGWRCPTGFGLHLWQDILDSGLDLTIERIEP